MKWRKTEWVCFIAIAIGALGWLLLIVREQAAKDLAETHRKLSEPQPIHVAMYNVDQFVNAGKKWIESLPEAERGTPETKRLYFATLAGLLRRFNTSACPEDFREAFRRLVDAAEELSRGVSDEGIVAFLRAGQAVDEVAARYGVPRTSP